MSLRYRQHGVDVKYSENSMGNHVVASYILETGKIIEFKVYKTKSSAISDFNLRVLILRDSFKINLSVA